MQLTVMEKKITSCVPLVHVCAVACNLYLMIIPKHVPNQSQAHFTHLIIYKK